jgi:hypothetical protein
MLGSDPFAEDSRWVLEAQPSLKVLVLAEEWSRVEAEEAVEEEVLVR